MAAVMAAITPGLSLNAVTMPLLLDKKTATLFGWSGIPFGAQHVRVWAVLEPLRASSSFILPQKLSPWPLILERC